MSKLDTTIGLRYGGARGMELEIVTTVNGRTEKVGELYLFEQYRAACEQVQALQAELERTRQTAVVYDWRLIK